MVIFKFCDSKPAAITIWTLTYNLGCNITLQIIYESTESDVICASNLSKKHAF